MSVVVRNITVSLDGFAAGPSQSLETPLGVGGENLHGWMMATRYGRAMFGEQGGTTGIDDDRAQRQFDGVGAVVMGRNMFGPVRGEWPDETWTGWWGPNPPYRCPVFVLTHHPRPPVQMEGGTTFHFVTAGIDQALADAATAANGSDVMVSGGASTVRQCLSRGLIDDMTFVISPVLLGGGERLFHGLDELPAQYEVVDTVHTGVTHVHLARK